MVSFDCRGVRHITAFATLVPGILLMAVTASVSGDESHEAIVALFVAGFVFTIVSLVFLGHSSYELKLESGTVILTKRWFVVRDDEPSWSRSPVWSGSCVHHVEATCVNASWVGQIRHTSQ